MVDVPGVEPTIKHDETEDILVYRVYSDTELRKINSENEYEELKQWLFDYDYIGVKIVTGRATIGDYLEEIELIRVKSERINEIKAELEQLTD